MMIIVTLAMINLPRGQILATEVGWALTVPIAASEKGLLFFMWQVRGLGLFIWLAWSDLKKHSFKSDDLLMQNITYIYLSISLHF